MDGSYTPPPPPPPPEPPAGAPPEPPAGTPPQPPAGAPPEPPAGPPPEPPAWQPPEVAPPAEPYTTVPPLPWEQPGYPLLEGLFETAKLFFTEPTEAFRRMSLTGSLGRPIAYAIIFGWLGIIAQQLYQLAMGGSWMRWLPNMPRTDELAASSLWTAGWSIAMMVVAPLLVLIGLFVGAAIVHVFLLLVGGANSGFDGTVRVMCYASTVQVLQVVPLCGGVAAGIWALVLEVVGLAVAHRTTQGKAALAVLLPVVLCCVCVAVLVVAFGAAIFAAIAAAVANPR